MTPTKEEGPETTPRSGSRKLNPRVLILNPFMTHDEPKHSLLAELIQSVFICKHTPP